jgi:hypothetical protein
VFRVISVYFNIWNTLPKSDTFLLGHPVYTHVFKPHDGLENATQTHGAKTDPLSSPEDTPKLNFASQPGRNLGPSKMLRRTNRSELRRTVSGTGYYRNGKGGEANRFTPRRSVISYSRSDVR